MEVNVNHDLRSHIKTKLRAEDSGGIRGSGQWNDTKSDRTGGGFYPRCLALTQGSVSHSWGIMHEAAWDQRNTGLQMGQTQKETSKGPDSHTRPSSTKPRHPLLLHPFIASFLSCSPKVSLLWLLLTQHQWRLRGCNAEREEGDEPPTLLPSCIDLVITQMQIFPSDPLRSADETPITLL